MSDVFDEYLDAFRVTATKIFAANPALQSVMLAVSQFWADEADDAVHETIIASERAMPVWPHRCDDDTEHVPGEVCASCGELEARIDSWDDNGEAVIAFESWCHEVGSQDAPEQDNALPCVLARKAGDTIEISMIGRIERIQSLLSRYEGEDLPDEMWEDPRALELYDQMCEQALDDGPRRVLADYLLERNLPRGEFIASSLAAGSDIAVRRDNLLAEHRHDWLCPFGPDVPQATAVFRRGFLAEADIYGGHPKYRGHPVLRSVERLRVCGGDSMLHPNMRALREVGPCGGTWLDALAAADRPWSIERLEAVIDTDRAIDQLLRLTTMPALKQLTLSGEHTERAAAALVHAPWWKQLERLTIVVAEDLPLAPWLARGREVGVPWLAIIAHHDDPTDALGWEVAFGPDGLCEATLRGFTPHGSLAALSKRLPMMPTKLVASDHYVPAAYDAEFLTTGDRIVTI